MSRVLITQHVHIVKFFYFSSNSCISLKILYFPFTCYSIFDTSGGGGGGGGGDKEGGGGGGGGGGGVGVQ